MQPMISSRFVQLLTWILLLGGSTQSEELEGEEDLRMLNNDEKRLMDYIVRGYDRDVRPVYNASNPVRIQLGITLTQIFDMDEKNQVLTTNVWLDQVSASLNGLIGVEEWTDELLTWKPGKFGGMMELRVPCEKIWLPDIVLYNSADDYTRGYMNSKAMVHHDGRVFWPPPTKFRSTCAVDVTYFPFDDQTCILKLGSWTYNGFQVDVTNRTEQVDLTNYVPNGEWELLEARINRNVVYYSCCPEPFPDVTITLIIRRKTLFYMYNIVLPCMMMSVLTLLVFCMPPESGEKIGLGVTVLLAFSVFMLAIAEKMPETSDSVPLIGIYLTAVMAITSVSIIMTVVVLNLHYRGPTNQQVPQWVRALVLRRSASSSRRHVNCGGPPRQVCPDCYRRRRLIDSPILTAHNTGNGHDATAYRAAIDSYSKADAVRLAADTLSSVQDTAGDGSGTGDTAAGDRLQAPQQPLLPLQQRLNHHHNQQQQQQQQQQPRPPRRGPRRAAVAARSAGEVLQDEVGRALHHLVSRQQLEESCGRAVTEWRQLAMLADRALFWVFLIITTVSSLMFLVILPIYKRSQYQRPD